MISMSSCRCRSACLTACGRRVSRTHGVEEAKTLLRTAYGMIEADMARQTWAAGEAFTMADCAAAPALFYANMCVPFAEWTNIAAYFARLSARPSYARVLKEAEPYFAMIPK